MASAPAAANFAKLFMASSIDLRVLCASCFQLAVANENVCAAPLFRPRMGHQWGGCGPHRPCHSSNTHKA
jgi:hypothetical protein